MIFEVSRLLILNSCAAVDKISTDRERRAVPLRQPSFLSL